MTCELNDNPCDQCKEEKCPDMIEADKVKHEELKDDAFHKMHEAEKAMHAYFCNCEIGDERERAFQIYENIRLASRVSL